MPNGTAREGIDIPRWFRVMGLWLRRGAYLWGAIGLPVVAFLMALFAYPLGSPEDRFRLAGLALNCAGLAVVAIELARTTGQFAGTDAKGFHAASRLAVGLMWSWIKQYFREIPRWRFRDITMTAEGASMASATGSMGTLTGSGSGPKTPEQRLDELEAKHAAHGKVIEELRLKHNATATVVEKLSAEVGKTALNLKVFATEGIPAQAVGWVLLFVGTFFDGAAKELACLAAR